MLRFAPFFFVFFFLANANAQINDGFEALDDKKFDQALEYFQNARSNEKERILADWGIAQVLASPDYDEHRYDSAFALKTIIEKDLRKHKDSKDKKKWDKRYDLNPEALKTLGKPLADLRWKEIDGGKKLAEFDTFARVFTRMPPKTKKAFDLQFVKLRRAAVNGGATTYADIAHVLTIHKKFIMDSFPGRLAPLEKSLFSAYMDENNGKLDKVPTFFDKHTNSPVTKHWSTNAFLVALKNDTPLGWTKFLHANPDAPTAPYVESYAAAQVVQKPLTEAEMKSLTDEEKWLLEDLQNSQKTGVRISSTTPYKGADIEQWGTYIRRRAGRSDGFKVLKNMLQFHIAKREWPQTTQLLKDFGPLFPNEAVWVKDITELVDGPDNGIRPVRLSDMVNSKGDEYIPTLSFSGNTLAFCGTDRKDGISGEDIYFSERDKDGNWGKAQLNRDLSATGNEAPLCFTADDNGLVVFKNGKIYLSKRNATGWSPAEPVGVDFSAFDWVADMHFVPGEQRVFFVAQVIGYGGSYERNDIYMASKDEDGKWSKPEKLDSTINTVFNDRSPFIHPDQTTMYFSSSRPGGLGDLDVYKTVRLDDTWRRWSKPVNLGKNINTQGNNWGYVVTTDGTTAYYSAREESGKNEDLYVVELPKEARPEKKVLPVKVVVVDTQKKPIPNAKVDVRNAFSGTQTGEYRTSPKGESVTIFVPENERITVSGTTKGYFGDPINVDGRDAGKTVEIVLYPVANLNKPDAPKFSLNADILFDLGKSDLKPEANGQLRFLAEFIKREKRAIALGGHTDPTGGDEDNLKLSKDRAEAVKTALVGFGVPTDKVTAEGYGETKPICPDNTPDCHKRCRRVEIVWGE
jgi:OmpA-OmpF porin, OOP family